MDGAQAHLAFLFFTFLLPFDFSIFLARSRTMNRCKVWTTVGQGVCGWNGEREWWMWMGRLGCYVWRCGYDGSIVHGRTTKRWVRIIKNGRRISIGEGSTAWNPPGMRPREIKCSGRCGWCCGRVWQRCGSVEGGGDGSRDEAGDDERGNGAGSGHKRAS